MANHLRRQIREAVAGAVTGLTTTGARVYQGRVYPLEDAQLPGLTVSSLAEVSRRSSLPAPGIMERTLRLEVRAFAKALTSIEDTLDLISKEVETALAMPCAALAGMAKAITLISTDIELQGISEKPVGQAALTYEIVYMAAENAPDVAY
jgi:hypothetical protein